MSTKSDISSKKAKVGVIGLGYIGLPLAVEFAKAGFQVMGIDINKDRVQEINQGKSYLTDVSKETIKDLVKIGKLEATANFDTLKLVDIVLICVPTPLTKAKEPDMSHIIQATKSLASRLRKNHLVILESTTYPGTTEETILPHLQATGLTVGKDFYLAYSPERIDPGSKKFNIKNTPKLVSGITKNCTSHTKLFYEQVAETVIPVSSPKVAETAKLLENVFRSVNIALVNELMLLCDRMNIDIWEVIAAASSKPFGFMRFYPGPGLGGHCIPVDPFFLASKAKEYNFHTEFIELSGKTNEMMPYYVVSKISEVLNEHKKCINGARILILGVAYKRNVADIRESPALKIISLLQSQGADLAYHDPLVRKLRVNNYNYKSLLLTEELLKNTDCTVIVTDHQNIDYKKLVQNSQCILDTRNALANFIENNIYKI